MFDTMTLTKIASGLFGTLLVFLLGGWVAETIYHGGGHGDGQQAYIIEVPDTGEAEVVEEVVPFAELYAAADAASGEGVFRACRACHSLEDGVNGTGPTLYGVVGRDVDAIGEYSYSGALTEVAQSWGPEELFLFLENPRGYAPGTKMAYNGMRSPTDRVNLIAYLDTLDD